MMGFSMKREGNTMLPPMVFLLAAIPLAAAPRTTVPCDSGWRFLKAEAVGAEQPGFGDSAWRTVNLPHDWGIEGPFDEKAPAGGAGAFLPAGVGWYRKHFVLPADAGSRRVFVEFDGVMAHSEVWINGFSLGTRPNGYVSFRYELTGHLNSGSKENVLAVRADNEKQPASRWYAGAGINRHVRLLIMDAVHLEQWATFVTTPKVAAGAATVGVQTSVVNQSSAPRTVAVSVTVGQVKSGASGPQTIAPGKSASFQLELAMANPKLWSLETPNLYQARVEVREGSKVLDEETVSFGIREARFDADTGFWLNEKNFKIKGVCLHGDGGAVGTAVPLRVWERRLETLKRVGVNGIRAAHNPPDPAFLDLCDRMGFVVMDEMFDQWTVAKNPYDYHLNFREWSHIDTRDTVRRDRNHPSIVVYSAGNEIHDTPNAELAKGILRGLVEVFHANDPTRPVTQALFRPNVSHDYDNGLADLLDVVGQNYRENEILAAHEQKPARKILGTENTHDRRAWLALRDNAPYAGQFLWAGIDYLGESRAWPTISSFSGLLDRTGEIKPMGYERQSWWSATPMVHITRRVSAREVPPTDPGYEAYRRTVQTLYDDWTPPNGAAHEENVEVYSNCAEVELLLNSRSLGSKPLERDASPRNWRVTWEAGTLRAVCGNGAARDELRTAGKAAAVVLKVDRPRLRASWDDLAYVTAEVVDEQGVVVPSAANQITFAVTGPGAVVAVDNQDITSHEAFQGNVRSAYQGRCIAIVRASAAGRIGVSGTAAGLKGGTVPMEAR
jgi:beta-galactosidase